MLKVICCPGLYIVFCTIYRFYGYKNSIDANGPCTVYQVKNIASVKGIVSENGQRYIATIDNDKNEGLLIGAGTFTMADGKLSTNDATKVVWPNGYVLTIKLD